MFIIINAIFNFSTTTNNSCFTAIFPAYAGVGQQLYPAAPSTTWLHVILGLPFLLLPSTSNYIVFLTQSSSSFYSTCPNHLNPFPFTASDTDSIPILSLSNTTAHPSHHPHLCTLQSPTLLYCHGPCFTSIYHSTPNTRTASPSA